MDQEAKAILVAMGANLITAVSKFAAAFLQRKRRDARGRHPFLLATEETAP